MARRKPRRRKRGGSDGEWVNVEHSSDEDNDDDDNDEDDDDDDEHDDDEEEATSGQDVEVKPKASKPEYLTLEEKRAKAADAAVSRIFSDADFKRIDAAQLKKQVQSFRKGGKSKTRKRKRDEEEDEDEEVGKSGGGREELVDLASIEMVHKKRRHDKEARLATVMQGREGRDKFGSRKGKASEHASSTHKEKARKKNFMMVKHKLKFKAKRSFVEKARDLKQALKRSRKFQ